MNKEEKLEKLNQMKHYFFMSFWISFVLLILSTIACMVMNDLQAAFAEKFFHIDADDYNGMMIFLLGLWKILIIQFTLIPGIVLAIISKKCCCNCK